MKRNENPYMNPQTEQKIIDAVTQLKIESVPESGLLKTIYAVKSEPSRRISRLPAFALTGVAALAAIIIAGLAMYPKPSAADVYSRVSTAMNGRPYETVTLLQPDKTGKLVVWEESWYGPNEFADHWTQPETEQAQKFVSWSTQQGHRKYQYRSDEATQELIPSNDVPQPESDSLQTFAKFPLDRTIDSGKTVTYVFGKGWRMDIVIDKSTNLPIERVNYDPKGEILSQLLFHFPARIPASRFEPMHLQGVPYYNAFRDRKDFLALLARRPQVKIVHGIKVELYGVVIDSSRYMMAILRAGDLARPVFPNQPLPKPGTYDENVMNVEGIARGWFQDPAKWLDAQNPKKDNRIQLDFVNYGRLYVVADRKLSHFRAVWGPTIPQKFSLRIPIWKLTGSLKPSTRPPIGYAVFKVSHPLRVYKLDYCLKDGPLPDIGIGTATASR